MTATDMGFQPPPQKRKVTRGKVLGSLLIPSVLATLIWVGVFFWLETTPARPNDFLSIFGATVNGRCPIAQCSGHNSGT